MDSAIYHSGTGFIFAVRGQWIYKCSATDGSVLASIRFSQSLSGPSSIASIGNTLYVGVVSVVPVAFQAVSHNFPSRDIYKIDAPSFTVTGVLGLDTKLDAGYLFGSGLWQFYGVGWHKILTIGSKIYGANGIPQFFNVDPTNIPGYATTSSAGFCVDASYDLGNNVVWTVDPNTPQIAALATDFSNSCINTGSVGDVTGVTAWQGALPANNKVYAVKGTFAVIRVLTSAAFPGFNNFAFSTLNILGINANPSKIKAVNGLAGNTYNSKVLIPSLQEDTVYVLDPASDTITSTLTGFTAPWDIVTTPTKAFAVQNSPVGLKALP